MEIKKVLGEALVVERESSNAKVGSGLLFAPETRIEKSKRCKVLSVGQRTLEDGTKVPITDVKVGDIVLVRSYSGLPIDGSNPNILHCHMDIVEAIIPKGVSIE